MIVNGLPLEIYQVTSKDSVESILDRIEEDWKREKFKVNRTTSGEWDVVSATDAKCTATLQLIDRHGSFGYFGVSEPAKAGSWFPKRMSIPLPGNVEVHSSVINEDGGLRSFTVVFSTKRDVGDLDTYFRTYLGRAGWDAIASHEVKGVENNSATIITAQKGRGQVAIVLNGGKITSGTLNLSEDL